MAARFRERGGSADPPKNGAESAHVELTPRLAWSSIPMRAIVCLAAAALAFNGCAAPTAPPRSASASASNATAPLFRFHVDFWANLNQVLLHESLVPRTGFEGPKSLKNRHVVSAETLAPSEAAQWREALAYYDGHFTTRNLFDRFIHVMPALLTVGPTQPPPATSDLDAEWRSRLLVATPVYRAHFWPAHERKNRAYVEGMQSQIAAHGAWFEERLVAVYGMPLPAEPIDVEVTPVVPPFGGFTQGEPPYLPPNAALITISSEDSSYAGDTGVEMMFHEVSHLIVGRVEKGLEASAKRQGRTAPPRLWHDVIFYTAGHLARERFGPAYVPYAERPSSKLFAEDDPTLLVLKREWQPYLDRRVTMDAAIDALAAAF
jgi:hypothetical protein